MAHTVEDVLGVPSVVEEPPAGPGWMVRDSWTEAVRHLRALPRSPELLAFAVLDRKSTL